MTVPAAPSPATYPPEDHVLRDLRVETEQVAPERSISVAPLADELRNAAGAAGLGAVAAVVDVNCAIVALLAARPDWTATADLTLHQVSPLTEGPIVVDSRLIRAGANIVVVGVDVYDGRGGETVAAGRHAAAGLVTMARIPGSAAAATLDAADLVGRRRTMALPGSGFSGPVLDRIGLRTVDAAHGVVELDRTDYVRNSFGTINGGVVGMVFQAAAEAAAGPGSAAADLQIHYLSQTKAGPARTAATLVRRAADHAVYRLEAVDAGNDDQLLALATVTVLLS